MGKRELVILQICLTLVRAFGERSSLDWSLEDEGMEGVTEDELDTLNAKLNRLKQESRHA